MKSSLGAEVYGNTFRFIKSQNFLRAHVPDLTSLRLLKNSRTRRKGIASVYIHSKLSAKTHEKLNSQSAV